MKYFLTFVIVTLAVYLGYMGYCHYFVQPPVVNGFVPVKVEDADVGKWFDIKRVRVVTGDQFEITTGDDMRILGKLKVNATEDSKSKVVSLLNTCEAPKVRLVTRQSDSKWTVDIKFNQSGKEVDLATWLSENKLVYK